MENNLFTKGIPLQAHDAHCDKSGLGLASNRGGTADNRGRKTILATVKGLFRVHHLSYLRAVWREIYSLGWRIAVLRKNSLHRYGIALGSPSQSGAPQSPRYRRYVLARIRGIQRLKSMYPGATLVDQHLLSISIEPQLFLEDRDTAEE